MILCCWKYADESQIKKHEDELSLLKAVTHLLEVGDSLIS